MRNKTDLQEWFPLTAKLRSWNCQILRNYLKIYYWKAQKNKEQKQTKTTPVTKVVWLWSAEGTSGKYSEGTGSRCPVPEIGNAAP